MDSKVFSRGTIGDEKKPEDVDISDASEKDLLKEIERLRTQLAYKTEVIAYRLSPNQQMPFVLETLAEALKKRHPSRVTIHSDQGGYYTSKQYCELLGRNNARRSMSRKGNCLDDAAMESFFGHLKCERFKGRPAMRANEIQKTVHEYIRFYNHERIQTKFKMDPIEYRDHFEKTA